MLTKRLKAVADLVPKGARVADVGTDHAYLPIYLMEQGIARSCIATDIHKGPLEAAKGNIAAAGVSGIETRLCDGVCALSPDEADTVVIAGMGGDTAAHIVSEAPWLKDPDKLLIIQPMSSADSVRIYLAENGFEVLTESCVCEGERVYSVMTARFCGKCRILSYYEAAVGMTDKNPREAEYKYLSAVYNSLCKKAESIKGIERMAQEYEKTNRAAERLKSVLGEKYAL